MSKIKVVTTTKGTRQEHNNRSIEVDLKHWLFSTFNNLHTVFSTYTHPLWSRIDFYYGRIVMHFKLETLTKKHKTQDGVYLFPRIFTSIKKWFGRFAVICLLQYGCWSVRPDWRCRMKMVRIWIWSHLFTNKSKEICLRYSIMIICTGCDLIVSRSRSTF